MSYASRCVNAYDKLRVQYQVVVDATHRGSLYDVDEFYSAMDSLIRFNPLHKDVLPFANGFLTDFIVACAKHRMYVSDEITVNGLVEVLADMGEYIDTIERNR